MFPYRVDPIRPALIMIVVVLILAVIMPSPAARFLTLVFVSGPLVWSGLQWARRNRGVTIGKDTVTLQSCLIRRAIRVPLTQVQAHKLTGTDQLALVWLQPRRAESGNEPRPPRLRLFVTAAIGNPTDLAAALPEGKGITLAQLDEMMRWRRVRRALFWIGGLFVGVPALIIVVMRLIGAFRPS
jgi:hypothetical protein